MKNKMEAKFVNKIIFTCLFVSIMTNLVSSQTTKYLLFDKSKDSVIDIGQTKYYKIDKNLFDINRYNKIDTIKINIVKKVSLTSVESLWREGRSISDSILKEGIKKKKIKIIETNNQVFEHIYVLEKLANCNYKRTRVWWKDY